MSSLALAAFWATDTCYEARKTGHTALEGEVLRVVSRGRPQRLTIGPNSGFSGEQV